MAALPARRRARSRTTRSHGCTRCSCGRRASRSRAGGRRCRTCAATSSTTSRTEAADDALISVLRRLDDFRGASRFTTWAYKFALLEAAVKLRKRAWQGREIPLEPETWSLFSSAGLEPDAGAEQSELLTTLQQRDRRGADAAPAARARRARRERRADRRPRRAAGHDARRALQDPARRPRSCASTATRGLCSTRWRRLLMERPDLKQALGRLLGPAEPEVGCDECFDELDRYVELELAGAGRRRRDPRAARPPRRLPRLPRGARKPARARR